MFRMAVASLIFAWGMSAVHGEGVWPSFLGAGASPAPTSLPLTWSPTDNIAWQAELPGHGQSSPVIWGDLVVLTTVEGPKKETYHTIGLDLASGRELWRQSLTNSAPTDNSLYVSRAAPTPVVDKDRVIVLFESGDCVAFTHQGEPQWQRALGEQEGPIVAEFGLGASPCQTESRVYVLLEHDGPSCLLALDKRSGETVWRAERTSRRSWSSPAVIEVDGIPQIVVSSAGSVDGYDAETGALLWSFDDVGGNTATTPIDLGDGRFLIAASPGRQGENAASARESNGMMQIRRHGDGWEATKVWISEGPTPSWASPIVHRGLAYWVNRVGVVYCIDAKTGEQVYVERTKQSCWATPIAVDERLYLFGKEGLVTVLSAGREFDVLAENQTWDREALEPEPPPIEEESSEQRRRAAEMFSGPTLYGVAVTDGRIVARIGNRVFCIGDRQ